MIFHIGDMEQHARELLLLDKKVASATLDYRWPNPGSGLSIELKAPKDRATRFHLDIHEGKRSSSLELHASELSARKAKFQTRALTKVLVRIDFAKPQEILRHRNPDGSLLIGSHIHFFVEGYGDRFAVPVDDQDVICPHDGSSSLSGLFHAFLDACRIEKRLNIELPLEV